MRVLQTASDLVGTLALVSGLGLEHVSHKAGGPWQISRIALLVAAIPAIGAMAAHEATSSAKATPIAVAAAPANVAPAYRLKPVVDAPGAPAALQARLAEIVEAYGEPVGIAVSDVSAGWVAQVNGDQPFPQQSVSKTWVAIAVMDAVDAGRVRLEDTVMLTEADRSVFFQPVSANITPEGYPIKIKDLLRRALVTSDNAANDKLMRLVGGADAVREVIERKGLEGITVGAEERHLQARIAGMVWKDSYGDGSFNQVRARLKPEIRDIAMAAYLNNPLDGATPVGIVRALSGLKLGQLLSPASSQVILEDMADARTGPRRLRGGLPAGWHIAHKTGTGQDWRGASVGINDIALITAPDGHVYSVAVMIRRTRQPVPSRLEMMQSVTRAVVNTWATAKTRSA
ncbi:beta-lactamase class A [Caulobacter ginsengisoli]|uniref:beta-lactamase n=1 Tax=Caulobacter ginsengisoli TaxID=400775 RepID=A0ABU0ISE8_9CAUL|nr:serine hydrolase [Caulobacter ginsengisoli]MDQ0464935.1 beta-lactamase class A [Caulobacter ginsengisoli]